jgi:hypothetical protein
VTAVVVCCVSTTSGGISGSSSARDSVATIGKRGTGDQSNDSCSSKTVSVVTTLTADLVLLSAQVAAVGEPSSSSAVASTSAPTVAT